MKRLVILLLASAVAITAMADDLVPAPWANDSYNNRIPSVPFTTYSEWTYDDPCGVYSFDTPENSWFVSHPDFQDPSPIDPCLPYFSVQTWGGYDDPCDPCAPDWLGPLPDGRYGGVGFAYGSWDLNNFILPWGPDPGELILKDLWIQVTYFGSGPADWSYEVEGLDEILLEGDLFPVADPIELANGWWHTVFGITVPSPDLLTTERISLYPDVPVLLDQVIIETFQFGMIIPEPATMVLFGLSAFLMIRRKR